MTLKVAFDISVPASRYNSRDPRHGIYNVIEELLKKLCDRDDIDLTAVGLCGDDPLISSIKARLYLEQLEPPLACSFRQTFTVSPALTGLYERVFAATLSAAFTRSNRHSARRAILLATRSILYRLSHTYGLVSAKPVLNYQSYDLFHCPHIDLPDRGITGGLPCVITVYDLIPAIRPDFVGPERANRFKNRLARIDINSDWVICISERTRQDFCDYTGMSPDRCFVAPLAVGPVFRPIVDPDAIIASRRRYGIPEGNYFLTLGAPQPRKNIAHLIRSFFRLREESNRSDVYLVIAGSKDQGWMYDEIFATAGNSNKHRSNVIFTGYVSDEDLPALYSGAVAFVFPSLYEGFGMPPLEAMACGAPVISSNSSSLPEVVGNAGLMVDPHDEDALCQAMLDVYSDDSLRQDMSLRGMERARSFTWQKWADQTVAVYQAAVSERRSKPGGRNFL